MTSPRNAVATNRGRMYRWGMEEFVSVTNGISRGVPKPALKAWGERLVAETAVAKRKVWQDMTDDEAVDWLKRSPFRETEKAAAKGSDVHAWAEAHALGQPVEASDEVAPYAEQFRRFIDDFSPEWEMAEATVFSRQWGYAGTLDAYLRIGGRLLLVDYKTGKGVYPEVGLQLAAYRHAEFVGLPDGSEAPVPDVDEAVVLHLRPTFYEIVPVAAGESEFRSFLYALEIGRFCDRSDVVGQPWPKPNGDTPDAH